MSELSLENLLYVEHSGDDTDDMTTNIHILSHMLMLNILYSDAYSQTEYYRDSQGFRDLCKEIQDNVPKDVYVESSNNSYTLNKQHEKYNTYVCFRHCLEYLLKQLGW